MSFQILQTIHTVRVLFFHIDGVLRATARSAAVRAQTAADQLHVYVDHGGHYAAGLHDDDGQRVDDTGQPHVRRDDRRRSSSDDRPRTGPAAACDHRTDGDRPVRQRSQQRHELDNGCAAHLRRRRRQRQLARKEFGFGPGQTPEHVESGQSHGPEQLDVQLQQGRFERNKT